MIGDLLTCPKCGKDVSVDTEYKNIGKAVACPHCLVTLFLDYDEQVAEDYSDVWPIWSLRTKSY